MKEKYSLMYVEVHRLEYAVIRLSPEVPNIFKLFASNVQAANIVLIHVARVVCALLLKRKIRMVDTSS